MSINLKKHQESIIKAWKDVLDDKSTTDWALFGYDGQSNDLKLVSSGDGGLDELVDEMNSSKIMYAFLKVTDPQTSLHKYVLINWQGEGAPVVRKGTCAGHVGDVARLLRGAHATLHARAEEDLDADRITKLVATGASRYDFKAPRHVPEQCKPVTSTYKRIIPSLEINSKERDSFWRKEQEKENQRFAEESQKKNLANQEQSIIETKQQSEKEIINNVTEENKISPTEEARAIIESNRSIANSRAMFEKASVPQVQKNPAPAKPLRNSIVQRSIAALAATSEAANNHSVENSKRIEVNNKQNIHKINEDENVVQIPMATVNNQKTTVQNEIKLLSAEETQSYECNSETEDEKYSTIKRNPQSNKGMENENNKVEEIPVLDVTGQINEDELVYQNDPVNLQVDPETYLYEDYGDLGLKARALYDYQAADETEITFDPGDVITHIDCIDEGWWQGLAPDGTFGLFPANYVEIIQ